MPIEYDDRAWPIMVVTMPDEALDDLAFEAHLVRMEKYFERRQRFGLVVDVSTAPGLGADRRRRIADQIDRLFVQYPGVICGAAVVLKSALQRGVFRAIQWLKSSPLPMESFPAVEPATAWLRVQLGQPPRPVARASRWG